jgi:hypothetical protein
MTWALVKPFLRSSCIRRLTVTYGMPSWAATAFVASIILAAALGSAGCLSHRSQAARSSLNSQAVRAEPIAERPTRCRVGATSVVVRLGVPGTVRPNVGGGTQATYSAKVDMAEVGVVATLVALAVSIDPALAGAVKGVVAALVRSAKVGQVGDGFPVGCRTGGKGDGQGSNPCRDLATNLQSFSTFQLNHNNSCGIRNEGSATCNQPHRTACHS